MVELAADGSLLVVEEGRTGARQALGAKRRLENHHVRVFGLVVNRSGSQAPKKATFAGAGTVRKTTGAENRPLVGIR